MKNTVRFGVEFPGNAYDLPEEFMTLMAKMYDQSGSEVLDMKIALCGADDPCDMTNADILACMICDKPAAEAFRRDQTRGMKYDAYGTQTFSGQGPTLIFNVMAIFNMDNPSHVDNFISLVRFCTDKFKDLTDENANSYLNIYPNHPGGISI